ncbi:Gramicidin S biosynthesis protein GrsT [Durusdinium trenchii]|uniref:Gramicidin S biosynthesis protein GrsT n=1 Tax=Durusdinium trenchii TaxID=1381693 RepID=A0ABP0HFG9_9DINO
MLGFDHPESLQFEMQLTWVEDTWTIDQLHDHLLSEVRRIDAEYRRKPLQGNYSQKYVWFDRFLLRPRVQGRELTLQDYGIEPGFRVKISPFYQSEMVWGQPWPFDFRKERPKDQVLPAEDPDLLLRLDKGGAGLSTRVIFFPWLGGSSSAYIPVVQKMPKDVACYALDMPGRGQREDADGYPSGLFAVKVIAMTLAKELRRGSNYVFAHSQGSHFAYYVVKLLRSNYNVDVKALFVSNFAVPSSMAPLELDTLKKRQALCVPLRIFTHLVKGGWGCDPKLAYKSHMGYQAYQSQELWPVARSLIIDHWITKEPTAIEAWAWKSGKWAAS